MGTREQTEVSFPSSPFRLCTLPEREPKGCLDKHQGSDRPPPPLTSAPFFLCGQFSLFPPPPILASPFPFPLRRLPSSRVVVVVVGGSTARTMLRSGFPPPCGNSLPSPPTHLLPQRLCCGQRGRKRGGEKNERRERHSTNFRTKVSAGTKGR